MSDGLRAILDGNKYCPSDAEVDEWRALTLELAVALRGVVEWADPWSVPGDRVASYGAATAVLAKYYSP